ncbi:MAG: right-handed parallel beta-helix repeat-containing protein, partial [Porphyrobacter sp.]|nr:right-handed parallel beta-helix repeat-containing protein [Porphyrobacter sp.]
GDPRNLPSFPTRRSPILPGSAPPGLWNVLNTADVIGAGSVRAGGAISTTMSYSFPLLGGWAMGLFALQPADPRIVTNTNDSGTGSLRAAISFANSNPGADTISFAIPGAGPHTITVTSALPDLTDNGTVIDGTTQAGSVCRDLWAGGGHDLRINLTGGSSFAGLRLAGANQTVRGLSLTGFDNAVELQAASSAASVQCTYLGLGANGTTLGNARGVFVFGSGARIGGLAAGEGNVISGNGVAAIVTASGSTDTAIRGNFIGTDPAGMAARANGTAINHFFGPASWRDITQNLIAGNGAGIVLEADDAISPATDLVRIQRNRIGFNRTLGALLLNGSNNAAILFPSGSITNALIGGLAATDGNEIAASRDGIVLQAVSNIQISGNTIARSTMRGIWIEGASNITIGGSAPGQGNSIGGNGSDGIRVLANSTNVMILGNLIQPVTIAGSTVANADHGIALDNVSNITIGNGTAAGRNVIGGNLRRGIFGSGTVSNVTINGNYIGTDASGNVAVYGGQSEASSRRDAIVFDNGTYSAITIRGNVVGGYTSSLTEFWNTTATDIIIQGNNLGVGADGVSQIVSGNVEDLIYIGGNPRGYSNVLIGGSNAGEGNLIAFSARSGMRVTSTGSNLQVIGNTFRNNTRNGVYVLDSTRVALVSNRIFANGLLGIDLGDNGVTANDAGDGDSGANELLNFPEAIRAVVTGPNQLAYNFRLDAPAAPAGYRIEFFASTAADPTGFGEGERFLGHVNIAHGGGVQSFTGTLATLEPVSIGDIISATTGRRTSGGTVDITSEFSAVATADGVAQLAVVITSEVFDPPAGNPFAAPGNDVLLTTTITNGGTGSTDADSVFAVIAISPETSFFNAVTPTMGGIVGFSAGAPSLTFNPATDLRFSNATAAPQSLAQCTYSPVTGYDPQVRYVCLNPKGTLPSGAGQGQMQVQLRLRIN